MSNLILISVKEKYVNEMIAGRKTIELRKAKPKANPGDTLIIYTTQPRKAITAVATVKSIIICSPEEMWANYGECLGIDKKSFDNYYSSATKAIGIAMSDISPLNAEILLSAIKIIRPGFAPPQTFKYLNKFSTLREFGHLLS